MLEAVQHDLDECKIKVTEALEKAVRKFTDEMFQFELRFMCLKFDFKRYENKLTQLANEFNNTIAHKTLLIISEFKQYHK